MIKTPVYFFSIHPSWSVRRRGSQETLVEWEVRLVELHYSSLIVVRYLHGSPTVHHRVYKTTSVRLCSTRGYHRVMWSAKKIVAQKTNKHVGILTSLLLAMTFTSIFFNDFFAKWKKDRYKELSQKQFLA